MVKFRNSFWLLLWNIISILDADYMAKLIFFVYNHFKIRGADPIDSPSLLNLQCLI